MLSYNGEPITLQIIKNGFNECRHQQDCIKVKCKSPSRSKTLITSVSHELLAEIAGLARGVQGLRGKEGPLATGSILWRALKTYTRLHVDSVHAQFLPIVLQLSSHSCLLPAVRQLRTCS